MQPLDDLECETRVIIMRRGLLKDSYKLHKNDLGEPGRSVVVVP